MKLESLLKLNRTPSDGTVPRIQICRVSPPHSVLRREWMFSRQSGGVIRAGLTLWPSKESVGVAAQRRKGNWSFGRALNSRAPRGHPEVSIAVLISLIYEASQSVSQEGPPELNMLLWSKTVNTEIHPWMFFHNSFPLCWILRPSFRCWGSYGREALCGR